MTTKSQSMKARLAYLEEQVADYERNRDLLLAPPAAGRGHAMTRPTLLILLAALLLLPACGAWEDGAVAPTPTPAGYLWIPGEVGTPEPLPTSPPAANAANERQNQCIHALQAAHATMSYEEIVNGCGAMVLEAPAP